MKTCKFLFLIILLIGMINCEKGGLDDEQPIEEEPKNEEPGIDLDTLTGINFVTGSLQHPYIIVKYNEITGCDSTKYIFCLDDSAWKRLEDQITPSYPDPHFGFSVFLKNEIIYKVSFIPNYYSESHHDIITFIIKEPDLVYMELGYPANPENFTGEDLRNDPRLIAKLEKDNKLITLED